MMTNSEKYEMLAEGDTGLPSDMGIVPRNTNFKFDPHQIESALKNAKDFELLSFERNEDDEKEPSNKSFIANIGYQDEEFTVFVDLADASVIDFHNFGLGNTVDEESIKLATQQPSFLNVSMYFGSGNLSSFHLQLKIMDAIVPEASLVLDFMSYRLLSAKWLKMTANSPTPPSPDYLYTIHCVYDEKEGARSYWVHTHGLQRCGSPELEMINIKDGIEQLYTLVNMSVKKFLSDPAKEKERFMIGYDGLGINLCWIRWEDVMSDYPKKMLGGKIDREGDDNVHAEPSGVLFAVEDGQIISPEIYVDTLTKNPIFYITNSETERMGALAKERFSLFSTVFHKEKDNVGWRFIVKLGLMTDDPEKSGSNNEHIWFDVISIDNDMIECQLINQPYWLATLNEGDINRYPSEMLTDWFIYSPEKEYSTDSIYELEAYFV